MAAGESSLISLNPAGGVVLLHKVAAGLGQTVLQSGDQGKQGTLQVDIQTVTYMLQTESHLVERDSVDRSLHPRVADTSGHVHPRQLDLASGSFEQYFNWILCFVFVLSMF